MGKDVRGREIALAVSPIEEASGNIDELNNSQAEHKRI